MTYKGKSRTFYEAQVEAVKKHIAPTQPRIQFTIRQVMDILHYTAPSAAKNAVLNWIEHGLAEGEQHGMTMRYYIPLKGNADE